MLPHKLRTSRSCCAIQLLFCFLLASLLLLATQPFVVKQIAAAQQRRPPTGGRIAVVVDERLAALRSTPELSGRLVRRLGRGRLVAIRGSKTTEEGIVFLLVNVTSRTRGWIQREAVVSASRVGDDRRLFALIKASHGFDRISRARIFLDNFPRSPLRPEVLLLLGDTAEELAAKLSVEAAKRLKGIADHSATPDHGTTGGAPDHGSTHGAPEFTYFMNYSGLDRYNRLRVGFVFDRTTKRFHYDGAAWRELIRRFPKSLAAAEARKRLAELARLKN